jgi:hypothetical protein
VTRGLVLVVNGPEHPNFHVLVGSLSDGDSCGASGGDSDTNSRDGSGRIVISTGYSDSSSNSGGTMSPMKWVTLVPHNDTIVIDEFDVFATHMVLYQRERGQARATTVCFVTGEQRNLALPSRTGKVRPGTCDAVWCYAVTLIKCSMHVPNALM